MTDTTNATSGKGKTTAIQPYAGSSPAMRTIFPEEIYGAFFPRTDSAQFLTKTENRKMRFPKRVKHPGFVAKIFRKSKSYNYYRGSYYAARKRCVLNPSTFSDANTKAELEPRQSWSQLFFRVAIAP